MAKEITSMSESALRCLCKRTFLPEDVNITLTIRSYVKGWLLHMWALHPHLHKARVQMCWHIFQKNGNFSCTPLAWSSHVFPTGLRGIGRREGEGL